MSILGISSKLGNINKKYEFNKGFYKTILTIAMLLFASLITFPLVTIVNSAIRPSHEVHQNPIGFPHNLELGQFWIVWHESGFQGFLFNSVLVVGVSLVLALSISTLASYALVQFKFPARKKILLFIIAGLIVPQQVLFVPLFLMMDALGLINRRLALIIIYTAFGIPLSVFFIRQFFTTIPESYAEAARIDGCSEFQILSRIYLPISIPALSAVAVVQYVWMWNEFLYALSFVTNESRRTLPAALLVFIGDYVQWSLVSVAVIISVIPTVIVFMLFQKSFVKGFTMGRL